MTTPLTIEQLHERLLPLPAGTLAVLETPAWQIPALRRDFDGQPTVSLEASIWRPDPDGDPSGYLGEFGPVFTESPDPVVYGLIRDGLLLTRGEIYTRDDTYGWREVHNEAIARATAGDVVFFGYPGTPFADVTAMLALGGGSWAVTGCAYSPLDGSDDELLSDVTTVSSTVLLELDWHESRRFA